MFLSLCILAWCLLRYWWCQSFHYPRQFCALGWRGWVEILVSFLPSSQSCGLLLQRVLNSLSSGHIWCVIWSVFHRGVLPCCCGGLGNRSCLVHPVRGREGWNLMSHFPSLLCGLGWGSKRLWAGWHVLACLFKTTSLLSHPVTVLVCRTHCLPSCWSWWLQLDDLASSGRSGSLHCCAWPGWPVSHRSISSHPCLSCALPICIWVCWKVEPLVELPPYGLVRGVVDVYAEHKMRACAALKYCMSDVMGKTWSLVVLYFILICSWELSSCWWARFLHVQFALGKQHLWQKPSNFCAGFLPPAHALLSILKVLLESCPWFSCDGFVTPLAAFIKKKHAWRKLSKLRPQCRLLQTGMPSCAYPPPPRSGTLWMRSVRGAAGAPLPMQAVASGNQVSMDDLNSVVEDLLNDCFICWMIQLFVGTCLSCQEGFGKRLLQLFFFRALLIGQLATALASHDFRLFVESLVWNHCCVSIFNDGMGAR